MNMNVIILSFSSRTNGNCSTISQYISNYYRTNVRIYNINSDIIQPCGNCDYECLKQDAVCPQLSDAQESIMEAICVSDLVYFIVPNYCGFPCANYFAFNERSVGYFNRNRCKLDKYLAVTKRFIVVSNTEGFEDAMQQQTNDEPNILYLKSKIYKKSSIAGDILSCKEARADLNAFLGN